MACWAAALCLLGTAGCSRSASREVVVYASQDQVYAEPILREFTRATGIQVRPVFDSEAVKTVGLVNRLLAERQRPQCDVFWNNEEFRTHQLAAQGLFREPDGWSVFGYRSRRIVVNTNLLALEDAPRSLIELAQPRWRGKVAVAYPLFGTTATHFLALRQAWGEAAWLTWCKALVTNQTMIVDGNSAVARMVGRGEAWLGLTDFDDIAAEQRNGAPVAQLPLSEDALLIPNSVAVLRGAPNPQAAQQVADYLRSPGVIEKLVAARALEGGSMGRGSTRTLNPDWDRLLAEADKGTASLREIFLR